MRSGLSFRYLILTLSLVLYIVIAYCIDRHQTVPLLLCYYALFLLYLFAVRRHQDIDDRTFKLCVGISILFRAALLFAVPALSDDFYRFIWDGRLLAAGYHPFAAVPSFYMTSPVQVPGIDATLYNLLGATETYTVYPPVAQFIFWLSVKLAPHSIYGSMMVMKVVIFLFEVATLWILSIVLKQFNQPKTRLLLYALNPLVILEFTGNLHFEGIMIFFLFVGISCLRMEKRQLHAPFAFAVSICTKLIPLLFLPLLVRYLGWKKASLYWLTTAAFTLLLFLPLLNMEIVYGFSTSLGYYFQRFEFNASLYYLVREVGYFFAGFNIIQYSGPALAILAAILILYVAFRKMPDVKPGNVDISFFRGMLWCLFIYFLATAILHPWYIVTLFAISILTPYRFPLVWTGTIFLSYAGYTENAFDENLALVALEYIIVVTYLMKETLWTKRSLS